MKFIIFLKEKLLDENLIDTIRLDRNFYTENEELLNTEFLFPFIKNYFEILISFSKENKDLVLKKDKYGLGIENIICKFYLKNKTDKKQIKKACEEFINKYDLTIDIDYFQNEIIIIHMIALLKFEVYIIENKLCIQNFNFIYKLFKNNTKKDFLQILNYRLKDLIKNKDIRYEFSNNKILYFFRNFLEVPIKKDEYTFDYYDEWEKLEEVDLIDFEILDNNTDEIFIDINEITELYSELWYRFLDKGFKKMDKSLKEINDNLIYIKKLQDDDSIPEKIDYEKNLIYKESVMEQLTKIEKKIKSFNFCALEKTFRIPYRENLININEIQKILDVAKRNTNKKLDLVYESTRKNRHAIKKEEFFKILIYDYLNINNQISFNDFIKSFTDRELYLILDCNFLIDDNFKSLKILISKYLSFNNYEKIKKDLFLEIMVKTNPIDITFIWKFLGRISMQKKHYNLSSYNDLSYEKKVILDKLLLVSNLLNPNNKIRLRNIKYPIQIIENFINGLENNFEDFDLELQYKIYKRLIILEKLL